MINMFSWLIGSHGQGWQHSKSDSKFQQKNRNCTKESSKMLKMKNSKCHTEYCWWVHHSRLDTARERTNELEDMPIEVIQTETQRGKGWKWKYRAIKFWRTISNHLSYVQLESKKKRKQGKINIWRNTGFIAVIPFTQTYTIRNAISGSHQSLSVQWHPWRRAMSVNFPYTCASRGSIFSF